MKENGGNSKCSFRKSYGRYFSTFHKDGKWGALISKIISFNFCMCHTRYGYRLLRTGMRHFKMRLITYIYKIKKMGKTIIF